MIKQMRRLRKATVVALFSMLLFTGMCFLTACQGTPSQNVVAQKADSLEEGIKQTAPPTEQTAVEEEERWEYQKEYDSGKSLNVDAVLINKNKADIPVISVRLKPFEGGQQLKSIIGVFCPGAKVYDNVDFTKPYLEQEILDLNEEIFRVENDMLPYPGAEQRIPDSQKESYIKSLRDAIKSYEELLKTAPELSELDEASFEFTDAGDSFQSTMQAVTADRVVFFDFVNWDATGSDFFLNDAAFEYNEKTESFKNPSMLADDDAFQKEKVMIDGLVRDIGIDYMTLDSVSKGKNGYFYYYTRKEKGFNETYANTYLGSMQTDGEAVMNLIESEHLEIETINGQVVKANWTNPTEVIKEDNSNVRILPWEQIQETFKTQMDYMLSPDSKNMGQTDAMMFPENTQIYINKIELGLTKVLMKDSGGDYKLIPAWSFMGYDTNYTQKGVEPGSEICFLTINAIDGTVFDRGLMY